MEQLCRQKYVPWAASRILQLALCLLSLKRDLLDSQNRMAIQK